LRDLLNLLLHQFAMALRPEIGLVLKGTVDQVRGLTYRAKFLPINGIEIIGFEKPENPSCAFIVELRAIQMLRLFAGPLTEIESLGGLPRLRDLSIEHVTEQQSIPIDLGALPALSRAHLEWFRGAESIFQATRLRSLSLLNCPLSRSEAFGNLPSLRYLRLAAGRLVDTDAIARLLSLRWLGLLRQDDLTSLAGLSGHQSLRFLWLEACPKLRSLQWLNGMQQLETLQILDCGEIAEIEAVRSLPRLRHIHIHGSIRVIGKDWSFLRDMSSLQSVFIKGMPSSEADYWKQRSKAYDLLRGDIAHAAQAKAA
jgi:Leucine-rich repeat (LRR) protein